MRNKQAVGSVKWTAKNRLYLSQLGLLDNRTGGKKNNTSLSLFINQCVTLVLESGMRLQGSQATPEELKEAWIKYNVALNNAQIESLTKDNIRLMKERMIENV